SLADVVSFGVAPAVIILKSLPLKPDSELLFIVTIGTLVFSTCGVLRLVRFNVSIPKDKKSVEWDIYTKSFTGLPIPAAAAAAVSINLLFLSSEFMDRFSMTKEVRAATMVIIMILLGYLMVSHWKFPSLKTIRFRMKSFHLVFFTVILSLVIIYGAIQRFALVFFILSWGYITLAATLSLIRLFINKKSKTLKDFDPEPPE
ncbi:MAG: phosphatidylcholine/phosphatidylserine synthase, partial [Waddliaceae bacterium]|nr:phosphatidylcholine/phosphatidylserine synthase [Waddliaceae bacterium]